MYLCLSVAGWWTAVVHLWSTQVAGALWTQPADHVRRLPAARAAESRDSHARVRNSFPSSSDAVHLWAACGSVAHSQRSTVCCSRLWRAYELVVKQMICTVLNLVPNSGLRKFVHSTLTVGKCNINSSSSRSVDSSDGWHVKCGLQSTTIAGVDRTCPALCMVRRSIL